MPDITRFSRECAICSMILHEQKYKIFSNRYCSVFFHPKPCITCHIIVVPNAHIPILEMVADNRLGSIANITAHFSKMLIEETKATGTQVIIRNGIEAGQEHPHFMVHLIPRYPGDGLDFTWKAEYDNEGNLAAVQRKLHILMELKNIRTVLQRTEDIYNSGERRA